jgi:hypothetical protein
MRDFSSITDEQFDNMSRSEQAALMQEYGRSMSREISEHEAGLLADHNAQVRVTDREARDRQYGQEAIDRMRSTGGMRVYEMSGAEPWNAIGDIPTRQREREIGE